MRHRNVIKRKEQAKGFLAGLILGGAVASGVTLFNAPHSGKKMRKAVQKETKQVRKQAENKIGAVRGQARQAGKQVAHQAKEARTRVRDITNNGSRKLTKITS